jgi:hypothetical protein
MRRSGAGDSFGVTRYQCPRSMPAFTAPSASAASTSCEAKSGALRLPPATARTTSAVSPTRPVPIASQARGQRAIEATRYAPLPAAKARVSGRRSSVVAAASGPSGSARSLATRIAAKTTSSQAMNSR